MQYYLAIDIGASSGRHVLGWIEDGKLRLEEVYRFENGLQKRDGHLIWDTQRLFAEILTGMKRCREVGKIPTSVGVDTWALDYVLLDEDNQLIGETYGYRDSRTQGMDELVYRHVPEAELYAITGIQKQLLSADGGKAAAPGISETGKDVSDASGLFSFSVDGQEGAGIYECHIDPACKCEDKGVGPGAFGTAGISGKAF